MWPFALGLDNIRLLVQSGYTVLRVELEAGTESAFAEYNSFYIAGEDDKYRIHVYGYSGTAGTCKHRAVTYRSDITNTKKIWKRLKVCERQNNNEDFK